MKYKAFLYFFAIAIGLITCTINKTTQPSMNITVSVTLTPSAELLATPTQLPTPTQQPQEAEGLKYYWPPSLSPGLKIDPCASSVADDGFSFGASTPSTQLKKPDMHLKIAGGSGVHWVSYLPPCRHDYQSVTVRGQKGCVNVDTDRHYIRMFWQEGKVVYVAIGGGIQFEDLLTIAEALEPVDFAEWLRRLEQSQ